jgi:type I restriction enzyme S subunit
LTVDERDLKFISKAIHEEISNYTISSCDVYISIAGTIGLMGMIPEHLDGANLTENAAKLVLNSDVLDKKFLVFVGMMPIIQDQISKLIHAVGVLKLALQRIRTIKTPSPISPHSSASWRRSSGSGPWWRAAGS